jgi:hypothetical protein
MRTPIRSEGLLGSQYEHRAKDILSARFTFPPFTILNAREGAWQTRKRQWLDIGIQSELGRGYDGDAKTYQCGGGGDLYEEYKVRVAQRKPLVRGSNFSGVPHKAIADLDVYRHKEGRRLVKGNSVPGGGMLPAMPHRGWKYGDPIIRGGEHGRPVGPNGTPSGGTSVFDPVLCELVYRWFCRPGGRVLDPFAGGSVRGIVAGEMGMRYTGIDLSGRQLEANRAQAAAIGTKPVPEWIEGDALGCLLNQQHTHSRFDLIFTCPPYGDLERYSDNPADLSTMKLPDFRKAYSEIIKRACACLNNTGFAVFVVGDYRDKDGYYNNLPGVTIAAFEAAGLRLYNVAVLVTVTGSLPLRVTSQFTKSRKLGKSHQDVLVFAKGQPADFVETWEDVPF